MKSRIFRITIFFLMILSMFIFMNWQETEQAAQVFAESTDTSQSQPADTGGLGVVVPGTDDIAGVDLEITGIDFEEVYKYDLVKIETDWKGIISDIPAGENRNVLVSAYDASGNLIYTGNAEVDIIANHALTVIIKLKSVPALPGDQDKPVLENVVVFPAKVAPGDSINLEAAASDRNSEALLTYQWSSPDGGIFDDVTSSVTFWTAPPANGTFRINITVNNDMGYTDSLQFEVEVDEKYGTDSIPVEVQCFSSWNWYYYYAPRIKYIYADPARVEQGDATRLSVWAYDRFNSPLSYEWSTALPGSFDNPNIKDPVFTVSNDAAPGCYKIKVVVSNKHYSAIGYKLIKVIAAHNLAPVIYNVKAVPSVLDRGATAALSVEAGDPDGDALSYEWNSNAPGVIYDSHSANPHFTADNDAVYGKYIITVIVSDGQKSTTQWIYIEIKSANFPPAIGSILMDPPVTVRGGSVNLAVTASDPEADPLTYSWTTSCPGTFSAAGSPTTVFTVGSTAAYQTYTVNVTVSDGSHTVIRTVNLTVRKANEPPVISSVTIDPSTTIRGGTVNLAVTASDPDSDPLTYSWTTSCPGTFSAGSSATTNFTVGSTAAYQTYTVNVTVSDGIHTVTGTVNLTVVKANEPPVISSIAIDPSTTIRGGTVNLAVTASDPDGDSLTYTWTTACPGTFSASGSPTTVFTVGSTAAYQTYTVNVTVSDGSHTVIRTVNLTVRKANEPPVISSVTIDPSTTIRGRTVNLAVTASDPDSDPLTYSWTTSCPGTFSAGSSATTKFTVDSTAAYQTYTVNVTVSDGSHTVIRTVNLTVRKANEPPVISSITIDPSTTIRGGTVNLAVTASDPDGDSLTYTWTTACPGIFSAAGSPTTVFTVGSTAAYQTFAVGVAVSDGSHTVTGTVNLTVVKENEPPVIGSVTIDPSTTIRGGTVNLAVTASDPDSDPLTYSWTTSCPGTFSAGSSATTKFTVDSTAAYQTFAVGVAVSDGSHTVTGTVNLTVIKENEPPVIGSVTIDPSTTIRGGTVNLAVTASDPDSDPLTYSWTTSCPGTFSAGSSATTNFTVGSTATYQTYAVDVTVSDGSHTVTGTVNLTVVKENEPPVIGSVTIDPSTTIRGGTVNLAVTASDPDSDPLTYSWTTSCPGTFSAGSSATTNFTVGNTAAYQTYTITVTVSDTSHTLTGTVNLTVIKENEPPVISGITIYPSTTIRGGTVNLAVTASDPDSDPLTYSWTTSCPGTFGAGSSATTNFTVGNTATYQTYAVDVTVSDGSHTVTGTVNLTVVKENEPPVITSITVDPSTTIRGGTVNLTVTATDPDADPLTYSWITTCPGTFSAVTSATTDFTVGNTAAYQSYAMVVMVKDGNHTVSGTVNLTVIKENKPPVISSIAVDPSTTIRGGTVNLAVTASDPDSDPLTYSWTTSCPGTFSTGTGATTNFTTGSTAAYQTYAVDVTVSDASHTVTGTVNFTVIKENKPPVIISITVNPSTTIRGGTVNLAVTATDPDADPLTYSWTTTCPGTFSAATSAATDFTVSSTAAYQTYAVAITVSDGSLTVSGIGNLTVVKENEPPVIGSITIDPSTTIRGGTVNLAVTASDPDSDPLTYSWTTTCPGTFSAGSSPTTDFTVDSTAAYQTYAVGVTVSDGGHTVTGTVTLTVVKENEPPVIGSITIDPVTAIPGGTVNLAVTATDPDSDPLTYSWTTTCPGTFSAGSSPTTDFTVDSTAAYQTYAIGVTVSDGSHAVTGTVNLTVVKENEPPVIGSITIDPVTAIPGGTVNLAVTATDPDSDPLTYSWTTTCPGTFSAGTSATTDFTVDSTAAYQTYAVGVTVSDGSHAVTGTVNLTVVTENEPPVITSITVDPSLVYRGGTVNLAVTASDPDGDILTYSWATTCPGTFIENTSAITDFIVDSTADYLTYDVVVTVNDGSHIVTGTANLTVIRKNKPPVIQSISIEPPVAAGGETVTFTVTASDPDGDPLAYSWACTCPGTLTDRNSATASFTVSSTAPDGFYAVNVSVNDGSHTVTALSRLTVVRANEPPVIDSVTIEPAAISRGGTVNLSVTATDPDSDPLTYSWTTLCPGTFSAGSSASTTFTVGAEAEYQEYLIYVMVSDGSYTVTGRVTISIEQTNNPPFIFSIAADPEMLDRNESTALTAEALDPDDDTLTFLWSTDCPGSFDDPTGQYPHFTVAPDAVYGTYTITVSVSDGIEAAEESLTITVEHRNNAPVIKSLFADPTRIGRGGTTNLTAVAVDADDDILSYEWIASETGIFYDQDSATPVFTVNNDAEYGECTLITYISDGIATVPGSITINIWDPSINEAPVILSSFQAADEIAAGKQVIFRVRAKDPEGTALRFDWKKIEGSFSTPTVVTTDKYTESIIVWTAPSYSANPVVIKVDIADEAGLTVTKEFLPITVTGGVIPNNDPVVRCKVEPKVKVPNGMFGYAVDIYGNRIISSYVKENSLGAVAVYSLTGNECTQAAVLQASDEQSGDYYGRAIAIDQDTVAVGAASEDGGAGNPLIDCGAVYVYERRDDGSWPEKQILHAPDAERYDRFGSAVAVDGDFLAVGAIQEDGGPGGPVMNCGAVYVYKRDSDGRWNQAAVLYASNRAQSDFFGCSLDIRGDYMIVGAKGRDKGSSINSGLAYIFKRNANDVWEETAILEAPDAQYGDYFGISVAIGNNYAVVGAEKEDGGSGDPVKDCGAAYLFRLEERTGRWILSSVLHAPDKKSGDSYGCSVSLYNDLVIVGAMDNDAGEDDNITDSGAVYIYKLLANETCSMLKKVYASDAQKGNYFGNSVSVYGNLAVVGSRGDKGNSGNSIANVGAVYIIQF